MADAGGGFKLRGRGPGCCFRGGQERYLARRATASAPACMLPMGCCIGGFFTRVVSGCCWTCHTVVSAEISGIWPDLVCALAYAPAPAAAEVAASTLEDADTTEQQGMASRQRGVKEAQAGKLNPMGIAYLPAGPPVLHARR